MACWYADATQPSEFRVLPSSPLLMLRDNILMTLDDEQSLLIRPLQTLVLGTVINISNDSHFEGKIVLTLQTGRHYPAGRDARESTGKLHLITWIEWRPCVVPVKRTFYQLFKRENKRKKQTTISDFIPRRRRRRQRRRRRRLVGSGDTWGGKIGVYTRQSALPYRHNSFTYARHLSFISQMLSSTRCFVMVNRSCPINLDDFDWNTRSRSFNE